MFERVKKPLISEVFLAEYSCHYFSLEGEGTKARGAFIFLRPLKNNRNCFVYPVKKLVLVELVFCSTLLYQSKNFAQHNFCILKRIGESTPASQELCLVI